MNLKTLSTRVIIENYNTVISCIEQIKKRDNVEISLSQFVWKAIKLLIKTLKSNRYYDI